MQPVHLPKTNYLTLYHVDKRVSNDTPSDTKVVVLYEEIASKIQEVISDYFAMHGEWEKNLFKSVFTSSNSSYGRVSHFQFCRQDHDKIFYGGVLDKKILTQRGESYTPLKKNQGLLMHIRSEKGDKTELFAPNEMNIFVGKNNYRSVIAFYNSHLLNSLTEHMPDYKLTRTVTKLSSAKL